MVSTNTSNTKRRGSLDFQTLRSGRKTQGAADFWKSDETLFLMFDVVSNI